MSDLYPVKPEFAARARIGKDDYQRLYRESMQDPDGFWRKAAERLDWFRKPTVIKDVSFDLDDFRIRWFADGELNVSVNCLDRQLATRGGDWRSAFRCCRTFQRRPRGDLSVRPHLRRWPGRQRLQRLLGAVIHSFSSPFGLLVAQV